MTIEFVSLQGPVELVAGEMALRIPLAAVGDKLAPLARGIGTADEEYLTVVIRPWLAEKLGVGVGSRVTVDNRDGLFTITRSADQDEG